MLWSGIPCSHVPIYFSKLSSILRFHPWSSHTSSSLSTLTGLEHTPRLDAPGEDTRTLAGCDLWLSQGILALDRKSFSESSRSQLEAVEGLVDHIIPVVTFSTMLLLM